MRSHNRDTSRGFKKSRSLETVKIAKAMLAAAISFAFLCPCVSAQTTAAFLGRWDLTVKSADKEYPSWLEVDQKDGKLSAQFVGRWGNARPLPKIEINGSHITFVSPKEEESSKKDRSEERR